MIEKTIMERRGIKKANDAPISRETVNTILEQSLPMRLFTAK